MKNYKSNKNPKTNKEIKQKLQSLGRNEKQIKWTFEVLRLYKTHNDPQNKWAKWQNLDNFGVVQDDINKLYAEGYIN